MGLPVPATLSPSKVSSFKDCGLAFRFSVIDRLPEPPTVAATRGTLVHRALELLFWEVPEGERSRAAARAQLDRAWGELQSSPELVDLGLTPEETEAFRSEAEQLLGRYFELEDPDRVRVVGVELMMEAEVGGVTLRGIIDRLELDEDGELVVTDYKTGRERLNSDFTPRFTRADSAPTPTAARTVASQSRSDCRPRRAPRMSQMRPWSPRAEAP